MMPRIYLDNAATSWPKPESVYAAVDRYQRQLGAPAGRVAYLQASQVERQIEQVRASLAQLIGADDPNRIIFAYSGTDALMLSEETAIGHYPNRAVTVLDRVALQAEQAIDHRKMIEGSDSSSVPELTGAISRAACELAASIRADAIVTATTSGATARLVMLPAESHGYRARDSIMHLLWETTTWLDRYVKNAEPRTMEEAEVPAP